MDSPAITSMATIDEELNEIEKNIRALRIEYEQYFGGGRKRPPLDGQRHVEMMLKRYSEHAPKMNFVQHFRFGNLISSYAKLQEVWHKKLQQKEEGMEPRHFGAAAKAIEAERTRNRLMAGLGMFAVVLINPEEESEKVQRLYEKLLEARQATGEESNAPSLGDFGSFLRRKTHELKQRKACKEVEYQVSVERGKVRLRALVHS